MSVQTWKRVLSSAEYVFQTYLLNVRLGQILVNKPQKYKTNYTDKILGTAMDALENVLAADSIYLSRYSLEQDFLKRRAYLQDAKAQVRSVATLSFVFLETVRKQDYSINEYVNDIDWLLGRMSSQEIEIGDMCEKCHKLISGLIKSDAELYRKYIRARD